MPESNQVPQISIIIPVYNCEHFLKECLDSILAQTFGDWEAILVDDCSRDGSLSVCREYAGTDPRFRVYSMEKNSGPVAAREYGLSVSRGSLISYVDSDDLLEPEFYACLLDMLQTTGADMAMTDRYTFAETRQIQRTEEAAQTQLLSQEEFARRFFKIGSNKTICYLTDKLYRREVAQAIQIPQDIIHGEDVVGICQAMLACRTIAVTDRQLYGYRMNPNGITGGSFSHKDLQLIRVWDLVKEEVAREAPQYSAYADLNRKRIALTLLYRMHKERAYEAYAKEEQQLKRELKACAAELLRSPIPMSRKLIVLGYACCFPGMKWVMIHFGRKKS